jgi:hypothetical protein
VKRLKQIFGRSAAGPQNKLPLNEVVLFLAVYAK